MAAKKKATTPADVAPSTALVQKVGDETLDETPERLLKLLTGAARPEIFVHLETLGYSATVHAEGWKRLHASSGADLVPAAERPATSAAAAALAEVDAWDEDGYRTVNASLSERFPEVHEALMKGMSASRGAAALLGVTDFLDRLDEMERTGKPAGAREAITLLETRRITKAVRANLRAKIKLAQTPAVVARVDEAALAKAAAARKSALLEARAFLVEWSELARTVIKRRDYLIRLGLAHRSERQEPEEAPNPFLATTPAPKSTKRRKKR